jgi:hypothetical protein
MRPNSASAPSVAGDFDCARGQEGRQIEESKQNTDHVNQQ